VIEETLGSSSAFYAMFPGNQKFNVFPLWLSEDHHARFSSVFAPNPGHPYSEDLEAEYLNIFETRTGTPFFQDLYVDGVRVMLCALFTACDRRERTCGGAAAHCAPG
jgi:type IV secretion system protein VirB4